MKTTGKVFLIIALCCVVLGTTVFCVAVAAIRFSGDEGDLYGDTYNPQGMTTELDSISSINLNLLNEPVTIQRGGDRVVMEWSQRYDSQYRVTDNEGGTLSLSRSAHNYSLLYWDREGFHTAADWITDWIRRPWRGNGDLEDGSNMPVTITIPEDMDLSRIEINGVDVSVLLDNVDAQHIEVNGVNAQVVFRMEDISDYSFETNGIGSVMRVDGHMRSGIGSNSHNMVGASRSVEVNGVNAELNVWTD